MSRKNLTPAMAYLRTSSATNVRSDDERAKADESLFKDSDTRQREAIAGFAKRAGFEIVAEFYDQAVSGGDPIETRPGFAEMLKTIAGNGVRTIIVETANRFARDLMVQEVGYAKLRELGIELIAADSPHAFLDDGPTPRLIRQVLGAVAEFDKAMTVAKLRGARERKRREFGKCEGRKPHAEIHPDAVLLAKRLHRASPKTGERRSLRKISAELAAAGFLNERGKPYHPQSVERMIEGERPATG